MRRLLTIQIMVLTAASAFYSSVDAAAARLLKEANQSYQEMHPDRAVVLYREYLARYADRADVHVWLGAALLNLGSWTEASAEVERALKLEPGNAKAFALQGRVFAAREQWALAAESFTRAIKLAPEDADTWYFAARASLAEERQERAVEQFQQVLKLGRAQSRVYVGLGEALESLGRIAQAENALRSAVSVAMANESRPWLAYGVFLFKQQRVGESLASLKKAFSIDPTSTEVRFELGRVLYQAGQLSEAAEVLRGVREPGDCRALNLLSKVFRLQGQDADADRALQAWSACSGSRQ